jgi:anti-sigma regulatory factor (Ser/Thr protein kinase)
MDTTARRIPGLHGLLIELPAELQSLGRVRDAVDTFDSGLTDQARGDLALLATELFTNAVRHSGATPDERILVRLESRPGAARIEVVDPGPGFVPTARTPGARQVSGRGMFLLDQLADRWGVALQDDGFLVWGELWTADGRTRHRRLPPRMLPVGAERPGRDAAALEESAPDIPGPEEVRILPDDQLKDLMNALAGEEAEVSARRRQLHREIDALRYELARRLAIERDGDPVLQAADLEALQRLLDGRMPSLPAAAG